MADYSLGELANYKRVSYRTMKRRLDELKRAGDWKKTFPGKSYTQTEAKEISKLLDFTLPSDRANGAI